jgi:glycogen debranching enzyme
VRSTSLIVLFSLCGTAALTQSPASAFAQNPAAKLESVPAPLYSRDQLFIRRRVQAGQPFTVAGPRGVVLGQQEGTFEAWILPVKLLSHFTIRAEVEGYSVPIDLNADAAEIDVHPDRTTITYAHIAFTLRQTIFAPEATPDGTGAVVLFEIDSTRPMDLTFSFTPEMRPMWPQPTPGTPSAEWLPNPGAYILHTDFPSLAAAVTIPGAQPGIMAPYQEKPQVHPLELKLHFDPTRDAGRAFPLLMAVGQTAETATDAALASQLAALDSTLPALYAAHAARYARMQSSLTTISTPDPAFDDAFKWAEISIEQLRAFTHPAGETALVAGYFSSGDSARPGFGWFFGRDALYTLYAVNGMGDFALTRGELEFLIARQRADGKMMHEYSQTAAFVDWKSLPYQYAAADATPLFLTAMLDYIQSSGDLDFLRKHRGAIAAAWTFETSRHSDSDGDGIYDNSQGTGWVESWPGGMPHQEIYLALLDQQASAAMAKLAALLGDDPTEKSATARAASLAAKIESEYFDPATGKYAFSRNPDGSLDRTRTIYPALAWWSDQPSGASILQHPDATLREIDSHLISTDWGTRDVAENDPVYDPISYHQGSVWPLFTGWAALADYRANRPLSAYAHLMQNANQTTTQDLGGVTELLSGAFFVPFGRSTSHQLWSSAMVVTPALRGLFGITLDAATNTVLLDPHLPADWSSARVESLHIGTSICTLNFTRADGALRIAAETTSGPPVHLASRLHGAHADPGTETLILPLPPVEFALSQPLPPLGSRTAQLKVLSQSESEAAHTATLVLEGEAGTTTELSLRMNQPRLVPRATGATLGPARPDGLLPLTVTLPPGPGYQPLTVKITW